MIHAPFTRCHIPTAYLHYIQSWGCNEWGWLRLGGSPALSQMGARWRLAPSGLETGQITPTLRLRLAPGTARHPLQWSAIFQPFVDNELITACQLQARERDHRLSVRCRCWAGCDSTGLHG